MPDDKNNLYLFFEKQTRVEATHAMETVDLTLIKFDARAHDRTVRWKSLL